MKTKSNLPTLRFPEFKGEWEIKKLGEVAKKINSGKTPLGGESVYTESGITFIRSQNVTEDKLDLRNLTFISEVINNGMKNSVVQANDILLNITGASLGRSCVVPNDFKIGNVNQHVCIIRLEKENNPRFVQPILSSTKGQNIFESLQTGSGREGLNFVSIRSISIFFPTLPEQTKIANFLTLADEKLQALQKKKTLLEQYKKGVMQKIFSKQLKFKDKDGIEFMKWKYKNGNDLFEPISNKNHNSDLPILAISQEFGAVPRELINYQISVSDKSIDSYKVVDIGNFIISLRSFQGGIEYSNYKGICSPAYIILKSIADINNRFFKIYFKSNYYIQQLCKNLEGIRDGKMISFKYFSEIKLPYPCVQEQTKIANFLSSIDEKINGVKEQISKMEVWKKGLLQKMFV